MTATQAALIGAVRASVTGEIFVPSADTDWNALLRLAQAHHLQAMVCDGLQKSGVTLPDAVQKPLQDAYLHAFMRDTQTDYMMAQLKEALTAAGVRHIFLKGAVLKYDYPEPALRHMSDLDVLACVEDYDTIEQINLRLGATPRPIVTNHKSFNYPHFVVEFHPNLLHHTAPVGAEINPGWQYAKDTDSPAVEMTEEGLYLFTLCHLADHFVSGGVGVRFVLDVWVHRHRRRQQPDRAFVEAELARFGLAEFAVQIEQLAEVWFSNAPSTPLLDELGEYILTSGSYGHHSRAVLNAMSLSGGRRAVLWSRIFYPRAELEDRYPWCRGKGWLLPAAWMARVFKAVTTRGHHITRWVRNSSKVDEQVVAENKEKLQRFGIKK